MKGEDWFGDVLCFFAAIKVGKDAQKIPMKQDTLISGAGF